MVCLLWKVIWLFLHIFNVESLYGLAIPLLSIFPKEVKARNSNRYWHTHVHSRIAHNSQKVDTTEMPIGG